MIDSTDPGRPSAAASLWKEARAAFEASLELPPGERRRWLEERCAAPELRAEVLELLDAHEDAEGHAIADGGDFLRPPIESGQPLELAGTQVGRYRVVERLAEGGTSTVYVAEQERPRREVALKVLSTGLHSAAALQRFTYEAEILGALRHPGIAQVFDAGTHAACDGLVQLPWIAMELVEGGLPIVAFCGSRAYTRRARLELFLDVCDAVYHGHQNGVIHRDLKPGNILVDALGHPKVIDFGVARATKEILGRGTAATQSGQILGTAQYMSPEQLTGVPADVDVRSDVYSLGVVLYELLTGELPYEASGASISELFASIVHASPRRPSAVNRELAGDLEWILLRALEKDKERRYDTVAELSGDVLAYLSDRPVSAGPPGTAYRLKKFVRRNRTAVVASLAAVASLQLGLFGLVRGYAWAQTEGERASNEAQRASNAARRASNEARRASLAAERASRQAAEARAMYEFLDGMLGTAVTPVAGRERRVADVVYNAAAGVAEAFEGQPEIEAAVRLTVGSSFVGLGELGEAGGQFEAAIRLFGEALGDDHPRTLEARATLARLWLLRGEKEPALTAAREIHALLSVDDRASAEQVAHAADVVGRVLLALDRVEEAAAHYRAELAAYYSDVLTPGRFGIALEAGAGIAYARAGDSDAAEVLWRAFTAQAEHLTRDHPETVTTLVHLAELLYRTGPRDVAVARLEECAERTELVFGAGHPARIDALRMLLDLYAGEEHVEQRLAHLERLLLAEEERHAVPFHPEVLRVRTRLARELFAHGRLGEAEAVMTRFFELAPEDDPDYDALLALRGRALGRLGHDWEAREMFTRALERAARYGADAAWEQQLFAELGLVEARLRMWDAAGEHLAAAWEGSGESLEAPGARELLAGLELVSQEQGALEDARRYAELGERAEALRVGE